MASEPGVTGRDVERRLGTGQGVLTRWKRELKRDGQQAFPGKGLVFRSDPWIQYACNNFRIELDKHEFIQSMPCKGGC